MCNTVNLVLINYLKLVSGEINKIYITKKLSHWRWISSGTLGPYPYGFKAAHWSRDTRGPLDPLFPDWGAAATRATKRHSKIYKQINYIICV